MRAAGSTVELTVQGYQFPDASPRSRSLDHDANWLEIRGVIDADGVRWSFEDPCLLTVEARELGRWLRDVAAGGSPQDLWFVEPNLVFGLDDRTAERVAVRVTFSHESAPPTDSGAPDEVVLRLTPQELAAAAAEWEDELAVYPVRFTA
jgi:hypothetical protein